MCCLRFNLCHLDTPCLADKWDASKARPGPARPTSDGLFDAAVDGQDVFVDQVHGPRPVGDLIVQTIDEASSL